MQSHPATYKTMIITPKFVEHIPSTIDDGFLYISMNFSTAIHKCCCGCGEEVVTPFSKVGWELVFDGEATLYPSIGNWNLNCKSHYWIEKNKVVIANSWSSEKISIKKKDDRNSIKRFFNRKH